MLNSKNIRVNSPQNFSNLNFVKPFQDMKSVEKQKSKPVTKYKNTSSKNGKTVESVI